MSEAMLVADRLTRHFGGLTANLEVCITLERGKLHALLGPNGAGKSTCINMLSGDLPPSDGQIFFMGKDITGLTAAQRSLVGIGRSYQRTNIFPKFTVLENVRLAAQSRNQQPWRIFSKAQEQKWALDKARACIEEAGLGKKADPQAIDELRRMTFAHRKDFSAIKEKTEELEKKLNKK